jgi:hypothetical protein
MPRKPKPSHVVELPLATDPADCRRLLGMFTAGARLNNVLLQDGLRILDALRADPAWGAARALPRASAEQRVARQEAVNYRLPDCGYAAEVAASCISERCTRGGVATSGV